LETGDWPLQGFFIDVGMVDGSEVDENYVRNDA
jgi:hypothetical protein